MPTFQRESTPVESMTVRIETGNSSGAGTDDDVYLNIGRHRFSLDKRLYDDFERRDDDTYAVALGDATRNGLTIGDISRVSIEKSRDGIAGGWFLHGVTLVVNGRTFMRNRSIDRWLEDSKRVWTAPNLTRDHRTADVIPVWLQLREDDFGPQDTGDINIFDRNTSLPIAFRLGTTVRQTVTGAARLRGRLSMDNGDKARVTYRISSFDVDPPPPPPPPNNDPPPPPAARPVGRRGSHRHQADLARGHGQEPGHRRRWAVQRHRVQGSTVRASVQFAGLAAGASATMSLHAAAPCDGHLERRGGLTQRGPGVQRGQQHERAISTGIIC